MRIAAAPLVSGGSFRIRASRDAAILLLLLAGCAAQPPAADVEKIDRVLMLIQQKNQRIRRVSKKT